MTRGSSGITYFIDTSALLKAYISEKGSDAMDRIFEEDAGRSISTMAMLEAISVFQRLHSAEGVLPREQFEALCARLLGDAASGRLTVSSATPQDIQTAIRLAMGQYLTAVDAVHVAMAIQAGKDVVFVSSDEKLNRAAQLSGLKVLAV